VLSVEHVSVVFGGVQALTDVSFEAAPGEIWGIIGPNGAGKTTLFNVLSGLIAVNQGRIRFAQRDITQWPSYRRALAGISRTLQTPEVFDQLTVHDNVMAALLPRIPGRLMAAAVRWPSTWRAERQAVREAGHLLQNSLLSSEMATVAGDLSFGHQRMLEIYRAWAMNPRVMLLDEPLSGLTESERQVVLQLVRRMADEGRTVLWVEHHLPSVLEVAHRILVLAEGRVVAVGDPTHIQQNDTVRRIYLGEESPRLVGDGRP